MTLATRLMATWRLGRVLVHLVRGLAMVLLVFPWRDEAGRQAGVRWWSTGLLRALGVELIVHGQWRAGAKLVVANHVSWLDISAMHAICPEARFVSKSDVRSWPLISRLVDAGGSIYIERDRKRDALRVVHKMAQAMASGDTVAVFPEGTTADGHVLLPFHANLLQAAIASNVPIQPVALRYSQPGHAISPAAIYVGDTTLAQSLGRIASARGLCVTLHVLPAQSCGQADRRELARHLATLIGHTLTPGHESEPEPELVPRKPGADPGAGAPYGPAADLQA